MMAISCNIDISSVISMSYCRSSLNTSPKTKFTNCDEFILCKSIHDPEPWDTHVCVNLVLTKDSRVHAGSS